MINLIVLLITHSILDCFGCCRVCFDWKTHGFMGKTCHGYRYEYSQKYLGVTHAVHYQFTTSLQYTAWTITKVTAKLKPVTPFQHTMTGLSLFTLLLEVNGTHNVMPQMF
jgi:hypothetical protein